MEKFFDEEGLFAEESFMAAVKDFFTEYEQMLQADDALSAKLANGEDICVDDFAESCFTWKNIAFTHATRINVNKLCEEEFVKSKETMLICSDPRFDRNKKDSPLSKSQDVHLCEGYPLVCYSTNKALGISNSDRYEVVALGQSTFTARRVFKRAERNAFSNEKLEELAATVLTVQYVDAGRKKEEVGFHRIFRPAFCLTVHQSQGDTFEEPFTIYEWNHWCMRGAGRYVAFTRAQDMSHMQIVEGHEKESPSIGNK